MNVRIEQQKEQIWKLTQRKKEISPHAYTVLNKREKKAELVCFFYFYCCEEKHGQNKKQHIYLCICEQLTKRF